jgi:hypothetical protein
VIEDCKNVGSNEHKAQKSTRVASGRPPRHESRAAEFCSELSIWRQIPESMRPSLHALATKLGTTHQTLSYHLNRLGSWLAKENAKRIRTRAEAESREMTMRECLDAIITPGLFRKIEELRQEARRGPLNHWQIKTLNLFAKQGFSGAKEILQKCRQMTPQEERQARAAEKATMFAAAAVKHIERIRQEAERGPLPWRDFEILKILARRRCAGAKELLLEHAKSALPRPQVPQ